MIEPCCYDYLLTKASKNVIFIIMELSLLWTLLFSFLFKCLYYPFPVYIHQFAKRSWIFFIFIIWYSQFQQIYHVSCWNLIFDHVFVLGICYGNAKNILLWTTLCWECIHKSSFSLGVFFRGFLFFEKPHDLNLLIYLSRFCFFPGTLS